MTTPEEESKTPDWKSFLGTLLQQREAGVKNNSSYWRRKRANLRKGANPATSYFAFPEVLPFLDPARSQRDQDILLQLAALVAEYQAVPQFSSKTQKYQSLGQWAYKVSRGLATQREQSSDLDPINPDAVAQRLMFIHTLDAAEAINSIRRILALATSGNSPAPSIDYFDLFQTFLRWGNGFSPSSQSVRQKLLRDYYAAYATTPQAKQSAP